MKDISKNYLQIQGWMVSELKLSGNELLIFSLIYGFSQDSESKFTGSINYIRTWLNCSRPTAINNIKNLIEKGLIIKEQEVKNNVIFNTYKVNLGVVKNLYGGSKETLRGGSKETLPNNTNINNTNNSKEKFANNIRLLSTNLPKSEIEKFIDYWTEKNPNGKKMKFEKQKTFDPNLRLKTWESNYKEFKKVGTNNPPTATKKQLR